MIAAIFGQARPVRPEFVAAIHGLADGNPFVVEELLRALVAAGDIYQERGVWTRKPIEQLRIPRSVAEALRERTAALDSEARQALELAAILGREFSFTLLRGLTGLPEPALTAALKRLVDLQVLVEAGADRFAFRHALAREAIVGALLARERRALHRTIAELLERAPDRSPDEAKPLRPGLLAYHCAEAGWLMQDIGADPWLWPTAQRALLDVLYQAKVLFERDGLVVCQPIAHVAGVVDQGVQLRLLAQVALRLEQVEEMAEPAVDWALTDQLVLVLIRGRGITPRPLRAILGRELATDLPAHAVDQRKEQRGLGPPEPMLKLVTEPERDQGRWMQLDAVLRRRDQGAHRPERHMWVARPRALGQHLLVNSGQHLATRPLQRRRGPAPSQGIALQSGDDLGRAAVGRRELIEQGAVGGCDGQQHMVTPACGLRVGDGGRALAP